jgi:hypothetical protein
MCLVYDQCPPTQPVSDIDNLKSDDTSMLYHRSCYKTYTSRRNCGLFKVESAGTDHKPDTSQVPLLNEQTFCSHSVLLLRLSHFECAWQF